MTPPPLLQLASALAVMTWAAIAVSAERPRPPARTVAGCALAAGLLGWVVALLAWGVAQGGA